MTNYEKIKNMSVEKMAKEIFDKVEEKCEYCSQRKCSPITAEQDCIDGIIDWLQTTVDTVQHARWEYFNPFIRECSMCGYLSSDALYGNCKYCPNCGCKMDEKTEE